MCPEVVAAVGDRVGAAEFEASFVSHGVAEQDLHVPMILTASAAEKSILARRDHRTRRRAFTLREAAALLGIADAETLAGISRPDELAAYMDMLRRRARFGTGIATTPVDIEDPHRAPGVSHAAPISGIIQVVDAFEGALAAPGP